MRRFRSFVLTLALLLGPLSPVACAPPAPPTDGGPPSVTPSDWTRAARVAVTVGRGLLVVARPVVDAVVPGLARPVVDRAFDLADAALTDLSAAVEVYDARGGSRCLAYAAAGVAGEALHDLAQTLADQGFALGVPLGRIVDQVFAVVDTLVPACDVDAGFTSAGRRANERLWSIESAARARGVSLRRDLDYLTPALDGGAR